MYKCGKWELVVQSSFIWVSHEKPSSPYCVMLYFWWGCRRNLKLITLVSERVKPPDNCLGSLSSQSSSVNNGVFLLCVLFLPRHSMFYVDSQLTRQVIALNIACAGRTRQRRKTKNFRICSVLAVASRSSNKCLPIFFFFFFQLHPVRTISFTYHLISWFDSHRKWPNESVRLIPAVASL